MNRWLDCIQIWYCCFLGISDDLINFWDDSIKNQMAAAAIKKKIDVVGVGVIFFSLFLDIDGRSLRLRGPAMAIFLCTFSDCLFFELLILIFSPSFNF